MWPTPDPGQGPKNQSWAFSERPLLVPPLGPGSKRYRGVKRIVQVGGFPRGDPAGPPWWVSRFHLGPPGGLPQGVSKNIRAGELALPAALISSIRWIMERIRNWSGAGPGSGVDRNCNCNWIWIVLPTSAFSMGPFACACRIQGAHARAATRLRNMRAMIATIRHQFGAFRSSSRRMHDPRRDLLPQVQDERKLVPPLQHALSHDCCVAFALRKSDRYAQIEIPLEKASDTSCGSPPRFLSVSPWVRARAGNTGSLSRAAERRRVDGREP